MRGTSPPGGVPLTFDEQDRYFRRLGTKAQGRLSLRPIPPPGVVREVLSVPDQFDVSLEDSDLLGEVELTTNLIIAASETDDHLTLEEIDEILGVDPRQSA